jgi:hypothetical protein
MWEISAYEGTYNFKYGGLIDKVCGAKKVGNMGG